MKAVLKILSLGALFYSVGAFSNPINNITIDKIEVYTDKSKILDLSNGGGAIPAGVKVVVVRTNNQSYTGWKFVFYGDSLNENLSLLLFAKAMNKTVNCVYEDRGNYWVQCVGTTL